jgi:hypothetical protein
LEQAASAVKSVYSELPCYDLIVPELLKGDIDGLQEACKLTPGKAPFYKYMDPLYCDNNYYILLMVVFVSRHPIKAYVGSPYEGIDRYFGPL